MTTLHITREVIPHELLSLMGMLSDEFWGDGHREDELTLETVAGEKGYALLVLMIAAYDYLIDPAHPDDKEGFEIAIRDVRALAKD